jgi:hypothetical protein
MASLPSRSMCSASAVLTTADSSSSDHGRARTALISPWGIAGHVPAATVLTGS